MERIRCPNPKCRRHIFYPEAAPQLRIHREPAPAEDLPGEPHHEEMHHQPWGEADVPRHRHPRGDHRHGYLQQGAERDEEQGGAFQT